MAKGNEIRTEALPFKPRARMLVLLGDQLIRDAGIAVFELVKNAYDADATRVDVTLSHVASKQDGRVVVEDDGCGMNWDQIVNVWLEPGTDHRQRQKVQGYRTPRFSRLPLGEKGVGRFAAHKLGKKITLISRAVESSEVVVEIDWNDFTKERYLSDASVRVSERNARHFKGDATGTRIEISDLNDEITRGTLRQIQRAITSVCSPFRAPGDFLAELHVEPETEVLRGILTLNKVLDLAPYRATAMVEGPVLTYDYSFIPLTGMERVEGRTASQCQMSVPDIDLLGREEFVRSIGPILLEFRIYDLDSQTLHYAVSDKKGFKEFLKSSGGVRVYRDGVRVYDYGEPGNDWLDLGGTRVNEPTARVSNNQVIAAVHLQGASSIGLVEKTNREGFIENSTFELFRKVVRFVLTQIVFERNSDKERVRALYGTKSLKEPVLADLEDLRITLRAHPAYISSEVLPIVDRVEQQYREMRDRLLTAAGTGLTLSVVIHEVEKAIKSLSVAVSRNASVSELQNLAHHLNELIEGLTYLTRKTGRRKEPAGNLIRQALLNTNYRTRAHGITIFNGVEAGDPNPDVKCTRRLIIATLMNLIDNSIYWLSTKGAEDKRIYMGVSTDLGGGPVIFVADNGPGFQDPPELLTEPFMTRRPEGMGLGLHIANEIMKAHDGKLIFPTADDLGISDAYCGAVVGLQFKDEQ